MEYTAKPFDRVSQEEFEEEFLSPYATRSSESKGRQRKEKACSLRIDFQRDRDRIIHCKSFRRLKHKTQVFIAPFGDHYRTRLTHTLEVMQIARTISRALRLNEDLTEAIALGHDLGHTPFGHSGEDALNDAYPEKFQHSEQSLRVVEKLEGEKGLNLTWEVRDGILNHSQEKEKILSSNPGSHPHTIEAEAVKIADPLAYVNHDIDDALRAGIIKEKDLPEKILHILGKTHKERIDTLIRNIVKESIGKPHIAMNEDLLEAFNGLRDFMYRKVYLSPILAKEKEKAYQIVINLYNFYTNSIDVLPVYLKSRAEEEGWERIAVDYIAGMTDRYALKVYKNNFLPREWG
ncbi:MAG: deoxyguanosinetriphosphate triphosphohydrolase [Candidatus Aerophobetes bacterium]|nr:deoxyguanosinetriphosphate triphosphohydrolase [Candidatus Aerophobetes bacterium]